MKFDDVWRTVEQANPQIKSGRVSMSAASFKKAMRFAWKKGVDEDPPHFDKIFGGMFK
jgi:hypothetical protein